MTDEIPQEVLLDYQRRTVVSVENPRWANVEHTLLDADVVFQELESLGPVPFTTLPDADTDHGVEIWTKANAGDYGTIAEYVAPPAPVPQIISRRQFYQQLANTGKITKAEALAAMQTGAIPPAIQGIIGGISDPDAQFDASMKLIGAADFNRDDPLVMVFAIAQGMTEADVDDFWRQAFVL